MLEKYPGESALFDIDCSQMLETGETITGTPAMSFLPALTGGDALTFGVPNVNTSAITYSDGRVAPAGTVVQVRISGGTAANTVDPRKYSVAATFSTSASNTLVGRAILAVLPMEP